MEQEQRSRTGRIGVVFYASLVISILFVLWGGLFTENLARVLATNWDHVLELAITHAVAVIISVSVTVPTAGMIVLNKQISCRLRAQEV